MKKFINFLFEIGTLRKLPRAHKTSLMSEDATDTIASHWFRVVHIAYILAKLEGVDVKKVILMSLFHDIEEARSWDQNRIHRRYVKVDHEQILHDQLDWLIDDNEPFEIMKEYEKRESIESKVAKDADILDQIFILKEYAQAWHKEAQRWLDHWYYSNLDRLFTQSAKDLFVQLKESEPQERWANVWTEQRRK